MRPKLIIVGILQAVLVAVALIAVRSGRMPLGVPGEWEWLRVKVGPEPIATALGLAVVLAYAGFVALGFASLRKAGAGRWREGRWLCGLALAAVATQASVQESAPTGYGLSKWAFSLRDPGSSGYYSVAKSQIRDLRRFLAEYPTWIKDQGSLHIGTHPPGLFIEAYASLRLMESRDDVARFVTDNSPQSVRQAFGVLAETSVLPRADRASMTLTGALTLLACALTVVPLYGLARARLEPAWAWASASLWALVPSAILFQPSADTAFPLLTTSAWLLATWSSRRWAWAIGSGLVLGLGMLFTLAFLPAGLIVAIVILGDRGTTWRHRLIRFFATGVGFLAATFGGWAAMGANPFAIWWANQANHAHFYVEFPRSYLAWLAETPIEVALAIGLPAVVWGTVGLRSSSREVWATAAVLLILLLTGRSLSEVARLWIPYFPMLLLAAGHGLRRWQAGAGSVALAVATLGAETLGLQILIQVVYPV